MPTKDSPSSRNGLDVAYPCYPKMLFLEYHSLCLHRPPQGEVCVWGDIDSAAGEVELQGRRGRGFSTQTAATQTSVGHLYTQESGMLRS